MFGFKDVTEFAGFLKGVVSEVPPEQWQALVARSPVLNDLLLSPETIRFATDMSRHSKAMKERLARVLVENGLATEEEVKGEGLLRLGQRLTHYLREFSADAASRREGVV